MEPAHTAAVCRALAALRGVSVERIAELTTRNAEALFRISPLPPSPSPQSGEGVE